MEDRHKKWLLIALLVGWAGLILWQTLGGGDDQRAGLHHRTGQVAGETSKSLQTLVVQSTWLEDVRTKDLAFGTPKNIFAPLGHGKQEARAETQRAPLPPPEPSRPAPPPPGPSPGELAAKQARQKLAQYQYLGFLTRQGESQAFLKKGSSLYIVKAGDTLEPDIRLTDLDQSAVTLVANVGTNGATVEQILPLTEE